LKIIFLSRTKNIEQPKTKQPKTLNNQNIEQPKIKQMKSITLKNKSKFPIVIEAWQTVTYNLSELESKVVKPGEKITIKSEDGEWFLQTYLQTDEWRAAKYIPGQTIGKIREEPIIKEQNGKPETYAWLYMYENDFKLKYNSKTRVATFIHR
jgi:hypothetical protein